MQEKWLFGAYRSRVLYIKLVMGCLYKLVLDQVRREEKEGKNAKRMDRDAGLIAKGQDKVTSRRRSRLW